jgi:hypothetical protein
VLVFCSQLDDDLCGLKVYQDDGASVLRLARGDAGSGISKVIQGYLFVFLEMV